MTKRRANREGSIFKEGSSDFWCAEITLPNGKRRRKRSKKQKVVKDWLLEQRTALRSGLLLPDEKVSFGNYLDRFLADVAAPTLKPKTVDSYRWLINLHIKPNLGKIALTKLRPDHLQSLYAKKLDEGLSKRTVQHMHAVIRRSLNQALKWGLIYRNPATLVTAPTPDKRTPSTLTEAQARLFLASVEAHRWYPIYVLAITTGMRQGEILGVHWEDVDLEQGTLSIQHTIQNLRGRIIQGEPKTSGSRRKIALPEYTKAVLRQHQDKTAETEGLLFTTSSGRPVSPRNVIRHFHRALEKAGLPRMRFHDLRHTAATLLLKEKVHPKVVQEMLGHSTITLTLDTYSHILPDIQQEAADKMDKLFGQV